MKIIVGLGNPGEKYKSTRHNVGFMALDFILVGDNYIEARPTHDFKSECFILQKGNNKVIFLKPQTYMNDSGLALKLVCDFYKINLIDDLLVIHDEIDLPFGTLRYTEGSSAAGHNGIKSIINELGTQNFSRLRVGIESRKSREELPTESFVLQDFVSLEIEQLEKQIFPKIQEEVEKIIAK